MKKIIPNLEALKIIEEGIRAGSSVRLTVRGNSMSPLLLDGVDIVILNPYIPENLKVGDVILFRYREAFLLHRIIEIKGNKLQEGIIITKGDALEQKEEIGFSDVVAVAELPKIGIMKLSVRRGRILINRIIVHIKKRLN
ncbi:MAG: peptidase [Bacteroidetes bacterium]|nr:peptidase [Bacteroidota bacterium]